MSDRLTLQKIMSAQLGPAYPPAFFTPDRAMLGAIPELDSMAVVNILTALEEQFGISIADDEITGSVFRTFGDLCGFVAGKLRS